MRRPHVRLTPHDGYVASDFVDTGTQMLEVFGQGETPEEAVAEFLATAALTKIKAQIRAQTPSPFTP